MPKYSVVIPVYNVEKYLKSCVDSVLNQKTVSDFEIILVNDGSKDGSGALCDRIAAEDPRISVIHQENQGVSAARNKGLSAAKGDFLLFLDSDDYWEPDLLLQLESHTAVRPDLIEYGYQRKRGERSLGVNLPHVVEQGCTGLRYVELCARDGVVPICSSCTTAFNMEFLKDKQLTFPMNIAYGEDQFFHMQCLKHAQSVYGIEKTLYVYSQNDGSVTHTPTPGNITDVVAVAAQMYRQFPYALFADYYCLRIWTIEGLTREDAKKLYDLLEKNRDILQKVSGTQARIARACYKLFGWYGGAKMLRLLANIRHLIVK